MCASTCLSLTENSSAPFLFISSFGRSTSFKWSCLANWYRVFCAYTIVIMPFFLYLNSYCLYIFMVNSMTTHFQLLLGLFNFLFVWSLSPQSEETFFGGWWHGQMAWSVAKCCKGWIPLSGGSPYLHCALLLATEEMKYWSLAGAKGIGDFVSN